jgi:prophage maintenance system killer protein
VRHLGIGPTFWLSEEAFLLKFPGSQHPLADGLRRFGAFFAAELLVFNGGRLYVDVDSIEQRPGDPEFGDLSNG